MTNSASPFSLSASDRHPYNSAILIEIGEQLPGQFKHAPEGEVVLEGALSGAAWRDGSALASYLIESLRSTGQWLDHQVSSVEQMRQMPGQPILQRQIKICIGSQTRQSLDASMQLARELVRQACLRPSENSELFEEAEVAKPYSPAVKALAEKFGIEHAGKRLQTPLRVTIDDQPEIKLVGRWPGAPQANEQEIESKEIQGFYDGRRLRSRTMFVVANDARGAALEVHYDEELFDQMLRSLNEDKSILLKLLVEERKTVTGNAKLYLRELDVVPSSQLNFTDLNEPTQVEDRCPMKLRHTSPAEQ